MLERLDRNGTRCTIKTYFVEKFVEEKRKCISHPGLEIWLIRNINHPAINN